MVRPAPLLFYSPSRSLHSPVNRSSSPNLGCIPFVELLERLVVKDGTRVTLIPVGKLDYAEAQDDYVALASQGKKHLKQQTIAGLEAGLNPDSFVRIHRSYIVNLERVVRIEPYGKNSRLAILTDGARLPVSRAGYARLKALLDERK